MKISLKRPSTATAIASLALCVAVGGGTAFAATQMLAPNSVGNAQLKNGAVTTTKIAENTIRADKLTPGARTALKGNAGARGPAGAPGAPGKDGFNTTPVTSLTGAWANHSGGAGTATIGASGAMLGNTGTADYAGISTNVLNGKTPAELSTITYTASYTQANDSHRAEPYFKLKLQTGTDASTCGNTDVVYNPSVQSDDLDYSGQTQTFDVTAPYSTVGVNNDANPTDGSYPVALHSTKNGASADVSGDTICLAEIILDGGSGADGATATISNVTFAGAATPLVTYAFGS